MDNTSNHVRIGSHDVPVTRLKLRAWLELEDIRIEILDAAKHGNRVKFVSSMYSYVFAASSIPVEELQECYWAEITRTYLAFNNFNAPNPNLPLIKPRPSKKPQIVETTDGWEYAGRSWYLWANIFASNYGWSLEYIAEMDVNDAFSLMQEIFVDEQLDREWQWLLSENSFSYDSNTKKSKFNPLKRPEWMEGTSEVSEIPVVRIKKSELPVGLVLRWEDGKFNKPQ